MRIEREKNRTEPTELEGLDDYDLDELEGNGYDATDPNTWPTEVQEAARSNWAGGPEAFEQWKATYRSD